MKYKKIRILFILTIFLSSFFFIYTIYFQKEKTNQITNLEVEEDNFINSNIIKDIRYSSKDISGNEYIILADEGEIDLNNSEIIFLKNVKAYINLIKKNETISVYSDFGRYNSINYNTIFSKNVKILYLNNKITGDYLDFSMIKNRLIISKNVVYTDPGNILKADVIELNTQTKDTKIFMHNQNQQVKIENQN